MNFWQRLQTSIAGGALLIASASLVSKALGLIRDSLLSSRFGASDTLDAYLAAFRLPDLVFNVLVLGALSSSFIPVFIDYWNRDTDTNRSEAWRITNSIMNGLLLILGGLTVVLIITAHWITPLIAPGFSGDQLELTTKLTRIMLISILFFGVSNVFSGILNAFKRFAAFAVAPVLYNLGIIIGITALAPSLGIAGVAWGAVLGAMLHMLVQLPAVLKTGFIYRRILDFGHTGVRRVFNLMLPRTMGLGINQLNETVITIVGSTLSAGSISVFTFANNLQNFPIGIVGVSLAVAAFPFFSEAFSQQDKPRFVTHFSTTFRRVIFLIIPASVLVLLLRAHIVRVILGSGRFDWEATYLTAQTLGYFAVSLVAQSLVPMLARSYYADQDTKTPVKIAIVTLFINIGLSLLLSRHFGILGLAAAYSFSNVLNMILLLAVLRIKHGDLDDRVIIRSTIKILVASAVMGFVTWLSLRAVLPGVNTHTRIGIFLQGAIAGISGLTVYGIIALVFRFDEVKIIAAQIKKYWQQIRGLINGGSNVRS